MKPTLHTVLICALLLYGSNVYGQSFNLHDSPAEPEIFAPGIISTGLYERDIAISPEGDMVIFTLGNYKQTERCLVFMVKTEEGWGEKQILPFSGRYHDIEPAFSPDGSTLFFASTRPLPGDPSRDDYNIWKAEYHNGRWVEPVPVSEVNTVGGEYYPSVSRNGNLYFTAVRDEGIGKEDIYVSRLAGGKYQTPELLDTHINSVTYEFNAFISPDEDYLIFGSYGREDDLGGGDMYLSRRQPDGRWGDSVHLGAPVNSDKLDYCPFVDFPRGNFYFTSERDTTNDNRVSTVDEFLGRANAPQNGLGDIYRISLSQLGL